MLDLYKMKIFDCFPFFNELEILELRLMELNDFVDYFVLVEANKSHNGTPKEFIFEKNKNKYKKYLNKIIYVKVDDMPEYDDNDVFKLEYFQRRAIIRGLKNVKIGDKILVSDCDEIPNVNLLKQNLNNENWLLFKQKLFYYYVNNMVERNWGGTVLATYGSFGDNVQRLRAFAKRHSWVKTGENIIPNGGWHYSYMTGGDAKRIYDKISLFAEKNLIDISGDEKEIAKKIKGHKDLYNRENIKVKYIQKIVDISDNKPIMLDKWLEKYPNFIYKE